MSIIKREGLKLAGMCRLCRSRALPRYRLNIFIYHFSPLPNLSFYRSSNIKADAQA